MLAVLYPLFLYSWGKQDLHSTLLILHSKARASPSVLVPLSPFLMQAFDGVGCRHPTYAVRRKKGNLFKKTLTISLAT